MNIQFPPALDEPEIEVVDLGEKGFISFSPGQPLEYFVVASPRELYDLIRNDLASACFNPGKLSCLWS